ncbi:MAG TPA: DNA-formamidopyrimidine glycosylase family protein [Acidimicrobiales bacterium]|nr:DNA-formamidopyrimidine glycosylase family protein [Acidimicrobiales bacterium]
MPELPEVEILARRLGERTVGRRIEAVQVASISALKTYDPPVTALAGRAINSVGRRGKYVCIDTGGLWLVFNLARSGWVRWREQLATSEARPGRGPLALRVRLEDGGGFELTEMATDKRLAVFVARSPLDIEAVATLGPEPLDPAFTRERLGELLAAESGDLKHVLSRQSVIAGVGNAYSDEALHAARLSPFKPAAKLSEAELTALHGALVGALTEAIARSENLELDQLKDTKRSGMRVHGRTGQACPVCGDTVREVAYATRSLQYCPTCQTNGRLLADRRLSRLLK